EVARIVTERLNGSAARADELGRPLFAAARAAVELHGSNSERRAAAAAPLDVRVAEVEAGAHEVFAVIELGAVQVEVALPIDDDLGSLALEQTVAVALLVEIHLVGEAGAAAADDLDAKAALLVLVARDERADLRDGGVAQADAGCSHDLGTSMGKER